MKKSFLCLVLLVSLSFSQNSLAWGRVGPGTTILIGTAVVVAAPFLMLAGLVELCALGAEKINHEIALAMQKKHQEQSSAQEILAQEKTIQNVFKALPIMLKRENELNKINDADFDSDGSMSRLITFLESFAKLSLEEINVNNFLCKFRAELLPKIEPESLALDELGAMFGAYEKNSVIPKEFITAAKEHLGLSEQAAKKSFSILYALTLKNQIRLAFLIGDRG